MRIMRRRTLQRDYGNYYEKERQKKFSHTGII